MTRSYYEVLGVASTASSGEIKSAYRNLAMIVHPDQGGPSALFQRVSVAYEVLADPARRDSYDLFLSQGGADPSDYHRRERHWRERSERRRAGGDGGPHEDDPREPTARGAGGDARVPPRRTQEDQVQREREHRDRGVRAAALDRRAGYIRNMVGGAALSIIGFWVVQVLWLAAGDDLDGLSDVLDLSWSSWWILVLATANVGLAFRIRARRGAGRSSANAAVATIVCSTLLLLVFLVHGARSDDLGVWPAAIGAVISVVSASLFRRVSADIGDFSGPGAA